jgi:hypothetical protein
MNVRHALLGVFVLMVCATAQAGICDAKFFHNGGLIEITGKGIVQVSARMTFSQVKKTGKQSCQAQVKGNASCALFGMLTGAADLDHVLTANDLQAKLIKSGPGQTAQSEAFDMQMVSIFGYGTAIKAPGQRLPSQNFRLAIGDPRKGPTTALTVRVGEKIVGTRQSIDTALGPQLCWPVRYPRGTEQTMANVRGVLIKIPAVQSYVTDWYCPAVSLVMKQEIEQAGQRAVIEVKTVR